MAIRLDGWTKLTDKREAVRKGGGLKGWLDKQTNRQTDK